MDNNPEKKITKVSGLYREWFLDYASYVILDRAIPSVYDGFKPVQRRILHSMKELEDGRYNKVANIVGNTMKYHPHGDASITDAMVQLGQKNLLIDTQGNWGNILTGDSAAAARYIEARLTPFALEVVFNPKTTHWAKSYDGRNEEPVDFPVKFPMLLALGVEGIGVGLSTKVVPHNFIELIDASIACLNHQEFQLFPDFQIGGLVDVSEYQDGSRGGRLRCRARIIQKDKNTLCITELPFGKTTDELKDSIVKATERNKIKVKKIEDNTSGTVEILIHLFPDTNADRTIDALYAFTDCQTSISPNACVIIGDTPAFLSISDILKINTKHTKELLKRELEIELGELEESWHFTSLERIFIENRIYRDIEEIKTWEEVLLTIRNGLKPFENQLNREITPEDIIRLTEIRIKRISRFDLDKFKQNIAELEKKIATCKSNLKNLTAYAVRYYENLKKKYGEGRERKTEIRVFDTINMAKVAVANEKLYINKEEGFVGTSLKKDEYIGDCSLLDDVISFRKDGIMKVTKVEAKTFIGKNIIYAEVFKKGDDRTIYNMVYREGKDGPVYIKRFSVTGVTRAAEYPLASSLPGSEVLYFSANPNGEAERINIHLKSNPRLKKLKIELDFADILIKGRGSKGNMITRYPVKRVELREAGISTLSTRKIWYDDTVRRLNIEGRGKYLGSFQGDDKIVVLNTNAELKLINFDLQNRFDDEYLLLEKFDIEKPFTCIYYDGEKKLEYIKRFIPENTSAVQNNLPNEHPDTKILYITSSQGVKAHIQAPPDKRGNERQEEILILDEMIAVKGYKSIGKQFLKFPESTYHFEEPPIVETPADTLEGAPAKILEVTEGHISISNEDSDKPDSPEQEGGTIPSLF